MDKRCGNQAKSPLRNFSPKEKPIEAIDQSHVHDLVPDSGATSNRHHRGKLSCPSLSLAFNSFRTVTRYATGDGAVAAAFAFSSAGLTVAFVRGRDLVSLGWLSGRNMCSCHFVFGTDATLRVAYEPCENDPCNTRQPTENTARLVEWLIPISLLFRLLVFNCPMSAVAIKAQGSVRPWTVNDEIR